MIILTLSSKSLSKTPSYSLSVLCKRIVCVRAYVHAHVCVYMWVHVDVGGGSGPTMINSTLILQCLMKCIFLTLDFPAPFHPHNELKYQIKLALKPSRRADPVNRIEVPFDYCTFMGGLGVAGKVRHRSHGKENMELTHIVILHPFLVRNGPLEVSTRKIFVMPY